MRNAYHTDTSIFTMFDSFDNLFAIHTYRFLCQGASKSVRLERWIVEAVVGAALKKIIVISRAIFNRLQDSLVPSLYTKFPRGVVW